MTIQTLTVILALAAALAGCGGGGGSSTPDVPAVADKLISAVGPVGDVFPTPLSYLVQRKLAAQSYINNTGAPLAIVVTVSGLRTLTAGSDYTGQTFARSNLSVVLNGRFLIGPSWTTCGDAVRCQVDPACVVACELQPPNITNAGPVAAGQSVTWQDSITWAYTLAPGDKIEATSIVDLMPVNGSGSVKLTTTGLTVEISKA